MENRELIRTLGRSRPRVPDDVLAARLAAGAGSVRTSDLAAAGYDRHGVDRLVRGGALQRVRQGAYVDAARFRACDELGRHLLRTHAVLGTLRGYAASHLSALAWWEMPVLRSDLGPVHVSGVDKGHSRRSGGVVVHRPVSAVDVTLHRGIAVVAADLAVLQTCRVAGARAGMIAAEAGLRTGIFCRDDLVRRERLGRWGVAARQVVGLAEDASESPGESLCRLAFAGLGLPQPEQQVDISDERGTFVARVDFLVRDRHLVIEFDGATKYAGADGRDALSDEKRREDTLRWLGYRVVRLVWADVLDPARLLRLLRPEDP